MTQPDVHSPPPNRSISSSNHPAKSFFFTWNNYPEGALDHIRGWEGVQRLVVGEERAPNTGTPHLQGFVTFRTARRGTSLKRCYPDTIHWEYAGSEDLSADYCRKESVAIDINNRKRRGDGVASARLPTFVESVKRGASDVELIEQDPINYARHYRLVDRLRRVFGPMDREPPTVYWFYGATGTGKTRFVWDKEGDKLYVHSGNFKWFDGYTGQEAVLFDDLRESQVDFAVLLRLLDRYPVPVEIKGGHAMFCPKRIYITAPVDPEEMFGTSTYEDIEQLKRRITFRRHFQ